MRKLSKDEKEFLKSLKKLSERSQNVFLANMIDDQLNNIDIHLDYEKNLVTYQFDQRMYEENKEGFDFMEFVRAFSWRMVNYIKLLKYLEDQNMIFFYQESQTNRFKRFGRLVAERTFISHEVKDSDIAKLICEYSEKTIIVNEAFNEFVRNNFESDEDRKHRENIEMAQKNFGIAQDNLVAAKKMIYVAKITIWITVGIFILGSILSFYKE